MKVVHILWGSLAQSDRAGWVWTMPDGSYNFAPTCATNLLITFVHPRVLSGRQAELAYLRYCNAVPVGVKAWICTSPFSY